MLKAVIFDMDGVLVDSEPVHFKANNILMKEKFGFNIDYEYYKSFIGSTVAHIFKTYKEIFKIEEYTWEELVSMADNILEELVDKEGYPQIKGAGNFVRHLKKSGYKLAIGSSSPMKKIKKNMHDMGIYDCFDVFVSGMDLERPKPFPDIFLECSKQLGVEPKECIVIEDSANGLKSGKKAGMACVGYINPNSGDQDLSEADYLFESFLNIDESFFRLVHSHCFDYPFHVMDTKRLRIREISKYDVPELFKIYEDKSITKYMEGLYPTIKEEIDYTEDYIKNVYNFYGYGMWILEKKDGTIIGRGGIEFLENGKYTGNYLGYVIGKKYQGMSYGYESSKAIIDYAFYELEIKELYVKIKKENIPSIKLGKKLGFTFEDEPDQEGYVYGILKK